MRGREHERERKQRTEVTVRQGGLILVDWISCVCVCVRVFMCAREFSCEHDDLFNSL